MCDLDPVDEALLIRMLGRAECLVDVTQSLGLETGSPSIAKRVRA